MNDSMQSPTTATDYDADTTTARSGLTIPGRSLLGGWRVASARTRRMMMNDSMQSPTTATDYDADTTTARSGLTIPGRSLLGGWRHTAQWTYLIMLIASAVALFASFVLSAETLQLARHPGQTLGCDINGVLSCSTVAQSWQAEIVKFGGLSYPNAFFGIAAESVFVTVAVIGLINGVLSCSTVAQSWQAEIVKFGGLSYPNAFFGIAAESVFVTVAVIGLCQVRVPRWFAACTWFGGLAALAYAYWLFSQSMFVINALCPWCMALMFSTTIQFMALSHATVVVQGLPPKAEGLRTYYRLHIDLMMDAVWVLRGCRRRPRGCAPTTGSIST